MMADHASRVSSKLVRVGRRHVGCGR